MIFNRRQYFLLAFACLSLLMTVLLWIYPSQVEIKQVVYLRPLSEIPIVKNVQAIDQHWQELDLSATAVYAIDLKSASLLYEKNAEMKLYPASTVKMMTALVAVQDYELSEIVTVASGSATIGHQADLQYGEQLTVEKILQALLVYSANDAAYVLANHHANGFAAFINEMNLMGEGLKLKQSYFVNPAGLDDAKQLTSARDLSVIARELLKNPFLRNLVAQPYVDIQSLNQNSLGQSLWRHQLYSSNQLLGKLNGVKGVKTGTTQAAGQVLVTLIERNGQEILISLMNSQDRYGDTEKLIAWIFNNYQFADLSQTWQVTSF